MAAFQSATPTNNSDLTKVQKADPWVMQNFRSPQPGIVFVTILLGKEMRQPRASNSACPGNNASAKEKDEKHVIKQH